MAASTEGIRISDVHLIKPRASSLSKYSPKFQIVIKCGSEERTSAKSAFSKRDLCVTWNGEAFVFADELTDDIILTFTIFRVHRFTRNILIGSCEHRAIDLLKIQNSSGSCRLDIAENCQLTFKIEKPPDVISKVVQQALTIASENLPNLEIPAEAVGFITSAAQAWNDNEDTLSLFIDKFQVFVGLVDDIAEISPYAKVAWSILSIIPKTVIAKKNRDDRIHQLCGRLKDVYDYITDAKRLPELTATQSKTLSTVVRQTIECAYFIQAYSTENTVKNIVKGIDGSVDSKIQEFNDKFDHLMQVMRDSVTLETGIVTLRVREDIGELTGLTLLKDMRYGGTPPIPKKQCLPGTRKTLIDDILKCINDDKSPQILVVSGQAGVGKSTIAHTIAQMFKEQNRLGSMFCFDRSVANRRNCLFSTISLDLADGDASWRRELVKIVNLNTAVRETEDPEIQFKEFIVEPSKNVTSIGPVVIVVDALDESGDRNERKEITEILFNKWAELPKNYRLIVTTRLEQDIESQCRNFNIPCKWMGDVDAEETRRDIQAFVSNRLDSISSILDSINKDWRNILARRAQGLFQWAQTACGIIDNGVKIPDLIQKNWETYVSRSSLSLYALYHQIILSQPESQYDVFQERFKAIVGAIITAREPLSIHVLQNIFEDDIIDVRSILIPFGSFFSGIQDPSGSTPVRPLHTSLSDFFKEEKITIKKQNDIAEELTNEYYIDTSNQTAMTLGCVKLMNRMLCFNICQFETSHLHNKDVPDFGARVEKAIPFHLSYSCRFWASHLQSSPVSEELIHEVRRLMDDNLLYYFEILSLLKAVQQGCVAMEEIANWCKDADSNLTEDAMDAQMFGVEFKNVMTTSTPHLYISALPFAPRDSFVSRQYLERYPGLFTFDVRQPVGSMSSKIVFVKENAMQIAFSSKGKYMAMSTPSTLEIWNYATGERVLDYEDPNSWTVSNIVFSPDGELVYYCFRGGDILIWNMGTRERTIVEYEGAKCNVCLISSDGRFIVRRTEEETLVFDRESCQVVKRFEGEYYSHRISPNGNWIALYRDENVYIWNTRDQTQHCVIPSNSPIASPSLTDSYIAFRQDDTTIAIWDVPSNTKVTEIRHKSFTTSVDLSPDDQYLLISSFSMYWIWRVSTGELISRCYEGGHNRCLGFSHDSKLIALFGGTTLDIRKWDEFIEQDHSHSIGTVGAIWLRGSYFILYYWTRDGVGYLQISDITTTNTIVHKAELLDEESLEVSPDEENVRVAYITSRGLCLWNDKEGEIVVTGSVNEITALVWSDNCLIFGDDGTINIWDYCTRKLTCRPIKYSYRVNSLRPIRGTGFFVNYGDKAEVRECELGNRVGETFTFHESYIPITVSASGKHLICTHKSEDCVRILDPMGAVLNSFPLSRYTAEWRLSTNGKYMVWIDTSEIKVFDVDTETFLTSPSLGQSVQDFWLSDDSKCIIIMASNMGIRGNLSVNIWDIQCKTMVTKSIPCPWSMKITALILRKRHLIVKRPFRECYVWDLDTYEIMSTLYNASSSAADDSDTAGIPASKLEILDYALTAWKKALLPAFADIILHDGWCRGSQNELLFWVPDKMRERFWFPCMTHTPHQNYTKLNFANFVHGSDWTKCKSGNN